MTAEPATDHLVLGREARELLFLAARTPNTFADVPVSDEQVRAIYDLVKFAPTSMNQQPLRVVLVRSTRARRQLLARLHPGNRAKSATAPLIALLVADLNFHHRLPEVFPHVPKAHELFSDKEARENSAVFNATLQLAYFIIGVRAAGLCAGPVVGYDEAGIMADFFPWLDRRVLAVLNIGPPGPDPWFPRLPRLSFDDVVSVA
ncbi:malonic semialdehyde reductase [Amycolatopsis sp. NPDC051128]|uniref:malonic semialdehyde reductase n=1 Tax=Amycolatopsis sp. NPDC051128 TaxID=3155412 RepID=UPI00343D91AE